MRTIRMMTVAAAAAVVLTSGMAAAAADPATGDGQATAGTSSCPTGSGPATSPDPAAEATPPASSSDGSDNDAAPFTSTSGASTPTMSPSDEGDRPSALTTQPGAGYAQPSGTSASTSTQPTSATTASDRGDQPAAPTAQPGAGYAEPFRPTRDENVQQVIDRLEQTLRDLLPDYELSITPRPGGSGDPASTVEQCGTEGQRPAQGLPESGDWLSGASGDQVSSGAFAAWRGSEVEIAGTWADTDGGQLALWPVMPGGDLVDWDKPLDIAIGALEEGETWEQAAQGAYDDRWRTSLTTLREARADNPGTTFIRFAHEMNGNWYPWSVSPDQAADFTTAWGRFRDLQQQVYPESQLVFCVNRETVGSDLDWRTIFPGAQDVDVLAVDYYNQYPIVQDGQDFTEALDDVDAAGAPKGLQQHLDFARSVGLPLAVPEWSGDAESGDFPAWITGMHDFFATNAGGGPGQVIYDILFDIRDEFRLSIDTAMPQSAAAYQDAF